MVLEALECDVGTGSAIATVQGGGNPGNDLYGSTSAAGIATASTVTTGVYGTGAATSSALPSTFATASRLTGTGLPLALPHVAINGVP